MVSKSVNPSVLCPSQISDSLLSMPEKKKKEKKVNHTHQTTLVAQSTVRAHKDVIGNGLTENLDLEDIGNNLLRLPVDIGVHQRNVIIAGNDIAQGRETLLHTLNRH